MDCRILIVDEMHPSIVTGLEAIDCEVDYQPDINRESILSHIAGYNGIVIRSKTEIDREVLDRAINLRFIARAGAGIEKIDEAVCAERGIRILNAPEGNRDALAEHAVGMLLVLLNRIHFADRQIRNGIWDREGNRGVELMGKTVGIIGYGNMGSAFARRISSFGCHVLAYDKYRQNYGDDYAFESDMPRIFSSADILSLHIPLTSETKYFYNENYFNNFARPLYLINTARGAVLPLSDLLRLLDSGKIRGAALDVLENEKINRLSASDKQIFRNLIVRENVVLTPHVGGWTFESYKKINDVLIDKINALLPEISV